MAINLTHALSIKWQREKEAQKEELGNKFLNHLGGVWFVFSNNHFQSSNNISRISIHFFTNTYFHNNNFQFLNTYTKWALTF